jgi:hypothetical protein
VDTLDTILPISCLILPNKKGKFRQYAAAVSINFYGIMTGAAPQLYSLTALMQYSTCTFQGITPAPASYAPVRSIEKIFG